jgi:hypothetical protein
MMSAASPGSRRSGVTAARSAASRLRYVDVWQSKDQHETFAENRLHPVVHPLLEEMLGFVPPEPAYTVLDLVDAWTDRHPG